MESAVKNLMFDLAQGKTIYDAEQDRVISSSEANDVLRDYCKTTFGITEKSSERDIKRALDSVEGKKFFQIIEEILDPQISYGWQDNEFFNAFVETKNLKDGDMNEFWTDDDIILNVAKVSGDHHDLVMQKLASGSSFNVPTSVYAVKVGTDIRLFLTGRKDWSEFLNAVAKAFAKKMQDELYSEFMNAASKLPVTTGFIGTGALSSTTKADFDEIISNVEMANNAKAVIMGTKTALKKINALAAQSAGSVTWVANSQKEEIAATGILGSYEGTPMIEIPQRFADNKLADKLVDTNVLLIFPMVDYKPVKLVDVGETTLEVNEKGATMNDQQSYEVQRRLGVATIITRRFGQWKFV